MSVIVDSAGVPHRARMRSLSAGVLLAMVTAIPAGAKPARNHFAPESLAQAVRAARSHPRDGNGIKYTWIGMLPEIGERAFVMWMEPRSSLTDPQAVSKEVGAAFASVKPKFKAGFEPTFVVLVAIKTVAVGPANAFAAQIDMLQAKNGSVGEVTDPELRAKIMVLVTPPTTDQLTPPASPPKDRSTPPSEGASPR
jgi:hypothetical protein